MARFKFYAPSHHVLELDGEQIRGGETFEANDDQAARFGDQRIRLFDEDEERSGEAEGLTEPESQPSGEGQALRPGPASRIAPTASPANPGQPGEGDERQNQ